ncbi:SCO6745 family protein [Actinoplanes regularis]|uniref:SalK n=1 Tax=Actinoplanes regularis TaxID=52697 RepID=A0A238ZPJ2_9ACTN|nr:hypothetical protein [Actinoplanes regularis]GIE87544.1 hypothetical protein Are01nite_40240 [Actinoplanes regularis]SNR84971.1 hypothetical protein SAMN06264365_106185 [Actinoplanes regularis]
MDAKHPHPMARQMWRLIEPLHAVLYYAPEVTAEAERLGYAVDTRWPSYFAWRAALLGEAGTAAVSSAFYSFSPRVVAEHIPAAWKVAAPSTVLESRYAAVGRALGTLLGPLAEIPEAATLARRAAEAAVPAGRPLAAANADLAWPDDPALALWHAATILREHRGDGHVAAALTAGLDPCELLVSFAAVGAAPVEVFAGRGWTDQEWTAARDRLVTRGLLHPDGTTTERGFAVREELEARTDELASAPWQALGPAIGRFAHLVGPMVQRIAGSGILPRQSTLGLSAPPPR